MGNQKQQIAETLENYSNEDIMLDAFWQWASNPTSASAGYALQQNYDYIKSNLRHRYGLTLSKKQRKP
jgi:hypothetical protein